ncbi:DMT family transporter [Paenibacillus dokdonensis]|uniref:DMT family transporter n=1 Tax=Paenibacillus dokdonensis TaxID=2567944 RepID=A0ABU6GS74_9BACL|nr:DMT family transporter [Paenibacillus dokdonensis]MEC0242263.1 DMT family transporter [Paenibacillus dokdonensis]
MRKTAPIPTALPLIIGIIAVSFSSIFVKWSSAPASIQGMYRLLFTALFMLPFIRPHLAELKSLPWKKILMLSASGFFLALHFLLWMGSLKLTTVSSSTIILALEPVFIVIGAFFIYKERTSSFAMFGMGVAIVGAVLIGWGDIGVSRTNLIGDLLSVFGTLAVSVHMLIGQKMVMQVSSFVYSFVVFLSATVVFAVYNLIGGISFTAYPGKDWWMFLLLAIVPTVFGHLLFNWLLQYVSASTISMSILGEPVGASILAFLLLNEQMTWFQIIGGILAISGLVVFLNANRVKWKPGRKRTAEPLKSVS